MGAVLMFFVGGLVFYSIIRHGIRLTQSDFYPMKIWGGLFTCLGIVMMIIFVGMIIRSLIQIITK
jgi:hypothetical protein